ncbi:putative chitinase 3 [Orchesella cincta]|uniref:Putative chitinase 3 n=1 Tax=Orchesella cincta TaxID=48709 RepID=A0A1D2MQI6_ORCCI|nr:putative chitinase 3 [Orchesella cincta]
MAQKCLLEVLVLSVFVAGVASQSCPEPNGYFADSQQCDAYLECKEGVAEKQLCPDGLMFNDKLTEFPRYPCSYPQEVECGPRTRTQPAQSTGECPRQYGLFRSGNGPDSCSSYMNCVGGKASVSQCPEGLAFDESTIRCDWPDLVPGCEGAVFRFQCPGVRVDADLGHPRYSDPEDCRKFYVCVENVKPRMHSCAVGFVFNPDLGVCDEPQNVPNCANYYPKAVLDAIQTLKQFDNRLL